MKIYYLFSFVPSYTGGKNRATLAKLQALKKIVNLQLLHPSTNTKSSLILSNIKEFLLMLKLVKDNEAFVISRDFQGLIISLIPRPFRRYHVIREMHSDFREEIKYFDKPILQKLTLHILFYIKNLADKHADLRIFNNPLLESHFQHFGASVSVYNGGVLPIKELAIDVELSNSIQCWKDVQGIDFSFCHTGGATPWHGIEILISFVEKLNEIGRFKYGLIIAGGKLKHLSNHQKTFVKNISPASPTECLQVIKICDAAIIAVNDIRVSPGSPLKMYDYIMNSIPIIGPIETIGYSDELIKYGKSFLCDFTVNADLEKNLCNWLQNAHKFHVTDDVIEEFTWKSRMLEWLYHVKSIKN